MKPEVTQLDWVRLAAFIDGEGCIEIRESMRRGTPGRPSENKMYTCFVLTAGLGSTDPRLPMWCRDTFGGHVSFDPRSRTNGRPDGYDRKDFWYWKVSTAQAEAVLRGCLPYFLIKREQAEVALAFRDTFKVRSCSRKIPTAPEVTAARRAAVSKLVELKKVIPIDATLAS